VLPHELFAAIAESRPEFLRDNEKDVLQFWDAVKEEEWYRAHPAYGKGNLGKLIPLTVHGDDACVHQGDKGACVISWTSILTRGSVWTTRFLFSCVPTKWMTRTASTRLFEVLKWSFAALLEGVWPEPWILWKGCNT
jgi:hypothetical protein